MSYTTVTRGSRSLAELAGAAVLAGAPESVADSARRITTQRFGLSGTHAAVSARVEAYFWGVVRRRALRGSAPVLADAMLAISLASELSEAGHAPDAIARQLVERFGSAAVAFAGMVQPGGQAA